MINDAKPASPPACEQGFGQRAILNIRSLHQPAPALVTDVEIAAEGTALDLPMPRSVRLLKARLRVGALPHKPPPAASGSQAAVTPTATAVAVRYVVGQVPVVERAVAEVAANPEPDEARRRVRPREIPPPFAL